MKKIVGLILTGGFLFVSALFYHASAAEDAGTINAEALFESKCKLCHSIERPKSKKKTKDGWKSTVTRMQNINGAPVSDEEANILIDYLAEKYGM